MPTTWFDQIKATIPAFYQSPETDTIVGYLRGASTPEQWIVQEHMSKPQMMILGSIPPTEKDWAAAGVEQRGTTTTIQFCMLSGFIVLYGGFVYRPWGKIYTIDDDAMNIGFPAALAHWKREYKGFRSAP